MPDVQTAAVPVLDPLTLRLPDRFTPQEVVDSLAAAEAAAVAAGASASSASGAATSAGYASSAAAAARNQAEQYRDETEAAVVDLGSITGALDLSAYAAPTFFTVTLTGNLTITPPLPAARAYTVSLLVTQGAGGGKNFSVAGGLAPYGVMPGLSPAAGDRDLVHLLIFSAGCIVLVGAPKLSTPAGW